MLCGGSFYAQWINTTTTKMAKRSKHKWLLNRLKCMTFQEVLYRAFRQICTAHEAYRCRHGAEVEPPAPSIVGSHNFIGLSKEGIPNEQVYYRAANNILKGDMTVFRLKVDAYDVIRNWNRDPKTGTRAPLTFGKKIDLHNDSMVGDIKYLWEPNRHSHLVPLSQAFFLCNRKVYLRAIRLHLDSWMDQCPYLSGVNWNSSLEVAIRLINWSIVWQLIGGSESVLFEGSGGVAFRSRWLSSIYRHLAFISQNLSLHSSANNHLIGEAAGLFIGANTWPYWGYQTDKWRLAGLKRIANEALKQVHPDGTGKEQAIAYHRFVLEFLILSWLSGRQAGISFPCAYLDRIEKMLEFLGSMMDVSGNLPMIGDSDDGYAVILSREMEFNGYRSILATGAILFRRSDFFEKAGGIDDQTRWLTGCSSDEALSLPLKPFSVKRAFPDGGYYVLGENLGTSDEIRCIVDSGPIGYLSIAAHGHADALSLWMSIGGREFLVDPGTYTYHGPNEWREYFRGTSAHNTLRIDGMDQSVSGGKFMWTDKANVYVVGADFSEDQDEFEGYHDGYLRLNDPVIHSRKVVFRKPQKVICVLDTVICKLEHTIERFWHFSENCRVESVGNVFVVENKGAKIRLRVEEADSRIRIYQGDKDLPQGWVSRQFDDMVPATTIVATSRIHGTTTLETNIRILQEK